jgi:hypothetical protein
MTVNGGHFYATLSSEKYNLSLILLLCRWIHNPFDPGSRVDTISYLKAKQA